MNLLWFEIDWNQGCIFFNSDFDVDRSKVVFTFIHFAPENQEIALHWWRSSTLFHFFLICAIICLFLKLVIEELCTQGKESSHTICCDFFFKISYTYWSSFLCNFYPFFLWNINQVQISLQPCSTIFSHSSERNVTLQDMRSSALDPSWMSRFPAYYWRRERGVWVEGVYLQISFLAKLKIL